MNTSTKISYGFGALGKDFSLAVVNTFLFFYLTEVATIAPATLGIIFLVARIWDMIDDPLWGYIFTKFYARYGTYKPWILLGNILNCVLMVACFSTHYFDGTTQVIYLAVVYICWGIAYTMCDAPFWALIPNITLDRKERENLLPYPRIAASLGYYLASILGIYAVHLLGNGSEGLGYLLFALLGGLLAILSALVTCKWTEQNYHLASTVDFKFADAFTVITKNQQFLVLIVVALCFLVGAGISDSVKLYLFKYALGGEEHFSTLNLASAFTAFLTLISFNYLLKLTSRRWLFTLALISSFLAAIVLAIGSLGYLPTLLAILLAGILSGFTTAVYWLLIMIMVADTIDYGTVTLNLRSEAIYYSINTLLGKCAGAISGFVLGLTLGMLNYDPNTIPNSTTINGMIILFASGSVLCLLSALVYWYAYKLNGPKLDEIKAKLLEHHKEI
ncbi:glycoside-pentoside-hexuronide (GPH):cation symporter [Anaerobiospirillum sp. NML120448]|uniref:glycoside-pentoside-hexuronide (GPH):cation symporter n=1 Tax=Anaerobiospirillum sp. NML120448 TaxID=2932816 RepID=UPI001FF27E3A|nr:glycoside-pentoside-hexuronide (GPH):cation symporter [Anaerobiospirillum sp. NML120448]MCK0514781.1 glycoside-pentoside-hexuronide (GPH):cation symporter [Anaerobiospirillum sp. NML120448]